MRSPTPPAAAWRRELLEIGHRLAVSEPFWNTWVAIALRQSAREPTTADDALLHGNVTRRLPEGGAPIGVDKDLRSAIELFIENQPSFRQEMELRRQPLNHQWLARGPGFLRQLDELVGPAVDEDVTLFGVIPCRGGWVCCVPAVNAILIEWLLTNVDDRVPEIARLAWLLTRLRIAQHGSNTTTLDAFDFTIKVAAMLEWLSDNDETREVATQLWDTRSPGSTHA